jgi:hypothetical protein
MLFFPLLVAPVPVQPSESLPVLANLLNLIGKASHGTKKSKGATKGDHNRSTAVPESMLSCSSNVSKKAISPKLVGFVPDRRFEERSIMSEKNGDSKKAIGPVRLLLFKERTSKMGGNEGTEPAT